MDGKQQPQHDTASLPWYAGPEEFEALAEQVEEIHAALDAALTRAARIRVMRVPLLYDACDVLAGWPTIIRSVAEHVRQHPEHVTAKPGAEQP